jgi:hypothetical protein
MRLNGRATAAAAFAVSLSCGSLPLVAGTPGAGAVPLALIVPATIGPVGITPPEPRLQPAASLAGIVVHAGTRKPLARARVTASSPALAEPRVSITAEDGRFEFRTLPAGVYSLAVTRTGFAPQPFAGRPGSAPAAVRLETGQRVRTVEIALEPAGVIAGQILDEDLQPFAGARVEALVSRLEGQHATLVSLVSAQSDDRGQFRLSGLPAGQYYVSAFDPAFASVGDETGALTYTPTYYPGTPDPEQARRVTVVPGAEPTLKVVFSLKIVRPARVTGRIATADRQQLISGTVIMSPALGRRLTPPPVRDVFIQPDGTFSFRDVPPGHYQIRARGELERGGVALFARFTIAVEGRDIEGVNLTLVPGASLEGSLTVDAPSAPRPASLSGVRVRAPLADGSSFGDAITGDVAKDGAFRIRGLMPGSHVIAIDGLPDPWVLKRITYRGQDVTDAALDVESGQALRDVRVTVTDETTDLSGVVRTDGGRAAADALVLVISPSPQFWSRMSRRFGLVRADADGRYRIRGLPPGEYRAVATFDIDESEATKPDLLRDLAAHAVALTLEEHERRALDLPLVSLADARRTVSR